LACALCAPPLSADDGLSVVWETSEDGQGDVRVGRFRVHDPECGYLVIADPDVMKQSLTHLEGVRVNEIRGDFQDITLVERFWPVGQVESRYHRRVDGHARVEWKLVEGRQRRHDGHWLVSMRPDGNADIRFDNVIEAKSFLHRALLRGIQTRTMAEIVTAVQGRCGI
jgi:hypothetical protein